MTQQTSNHVDNGVDLPAILEARTALEATPEAAQFTWRASCEWIEGVHSRSTIEGFYGLGEEQSRSQTFTLDADHPPQFAATDDGATPVEIVLCGLASCLAAGIATVAQNRGIQLHSVKAYVEGDMDLSGILGIDADVRNGFDSIRVSFKIEADASPDEIAALVAQSQKRSAVFDIITNPSAVHVTVE
ncbi:MAG: OsmC family protein [Pseudomonadota bacterium]